MNKKSKKEGAFRRNISNQQNNKMINIAKINTNPDKDLTIAQHVPTILNIIRFCLNVYMIILLNEKKYSSSMNILLIHLVIGFFNYLNDFSNEHFIKLTYISNTTVSGFLKITLLFFLKNLNEYTNIYILLFLILQSFYYILKLTFYYYYACDCSYNKKDISSINNNIVKNHSNDIMGSSICFKNSYIVKRDFTKNIPVLKEFNEKKVYNLLSYAYYTSYLVVLTHFYGNDGYNASEEISNNGYNIYYYIKHLLFNFSSSDYYFACLLKDLMQSSLTSLVLKFLFYLINLIEFQNLITYLNIINHVNYK